MMLPESMKLLPLYTSCLLKCRAFHSNAPLDESKAACAVWAKVEKAENARYYDCIATEGCTSDVSDCQPPTTTLGDEICDALNAKVGSDTFCNARERKELNENGAWWKDDVIAIERSCLALADKDDAVDCHWAWRAAVGF